MLLISILKKIIIEWFLTYILSLIKNKMVKKQKTPFEKPLRVAIIIGHKATAQGAKLKIPYSQKKTEYELYKYLLNYLITPKDALKCYNIEFKVFERKTTIKECYAQINEDDFDIAVELHFNASPSGRASGAECLVKKNASPECIEVAKKIVYNISSVLENRNRGVKKLSHKERGYHNVSQLKKIPVVLVEPFFGDNKKECEKLLKVSLLTVFHEVLFSLADSAVKLKALKKESEV